MKVLYIIDNVTQGGATQSFLELVFAMKQIGVSPIVCTSKKDAVNLSLEKMGIDNFSIGHRNILFPVRRDKLWPLRIIKNAIMFYIMEIRAFYLLKKYDLSSIDVIHTNSARNDIGCHISKKYGIPHIMHIREFADADFNCVSLYPGYIKRFNNYTNIFISISDAVKKHWINKGLNQEKILTIYNGVHHEDITISSDEDKKNRKLRLIFAGGVTPTKGQHIAIEAIEKLPMDIRANIELDIVGWYEDDYWLSLKHYVEDKCINNNVHFLGPDDHLHSNLGKYQVGLMCSKAEGFGRVTAEYMHAQLGVIASNSGANPELIQDGINGLLFQSGDSQSLAICITRLYNDRDFLVRLSKIAKLRASELYTQDKNAQSIYSIYKKIILSPNL